jgi:hypothetical protein
VTNIRTDCMKCVFRQNDSDGVQISCELNRLSRFIKRGEAEKEGDRYIINRFCNTCRDIDDMKKQNVSKQDVIEETKLSCCIIIDGTKSDYWDTIKSIKRQTHKPTEVYVVFKNIFDKDKFNEIKSIFDGVDIPIMFKKYYDEKEFPQMVDDVISKCKSQYYIPVLKPIEDDVIEKYNYDINVDLKKLNAVIENSYYNSFISCTLHKILNGNNDESIIDKIKYLTKESDEECQKTIVIN